MDQVRHRNWRSWVLRTELLAVTMGYLPMGYILQSLLFA